jgi:hypothetical protein
VQPNHSDNSDLPIGTVVETCNHYIISGIVGRIIRPCILLGIQKVRGYDVECTDRRIIKVWEKNLKIRKDFTDLEYLIYFNESRPV